MVRSRSIASARDDDAPPDARVVEGEGARGDAYDDGDDGMMRMMTTTTTTAAAAGAVEAMRANDGRAMFRTRREKRAMVLPSMPTTRDAARREVMRRKLAVSPARDAFRDGDEDAREDGEDAVMGDSRGMHRVPEFVQRPRDASGRPRAMR